MATSSRRSLSKPTSEYHKESGAARSWILLLLMFIIVAGAIWALMRSDTGEMTSDIAGVVDSATEGVGDFTDQATDTMTGIAGDALDNASELAENATDSINELADGASELGSGAADTLSGAGDATMDTLDGLSDSAGDALSGLSAGTVETADSTSDGIISTLDPPPLPESSDITEALPQIEDQELSVDLELPSDLDVLTEDVVLDDTLSAAVESAASDSDSIALAIPSESAPSEYTDTPAPSSSSDTVTVESGDYLASIARRVYGDAAKWQLIYDANRDQLDDPHSLQVGMKLVIPPAN